MWCVRDYNIGFRPQAVAIADVNGDGRPDIVTANTGTNTVSVLMNVGGRVFAVKKDYGVGNNPGFVALGDVNGDGRPDLVLANYGSGQSAVIAGGNSVGILFGRGDGTFSAKTDYAVGVNPSFVALADINGDGRLDIVTANFDGNTVSVLLNQGTGGSRVSGVLTLDGVAPGVAAQNITFAFRPADGSGSTIITKTAYVLPDGFFRFDGIPAGDYRVRIKGEKYLADAVMVYTGGGSGSGVVAYLRGGDANNDNIVDISDFGLLVNAYNGEVSVVGSGYDIRADFNGDGVVDIADFGLLVNNYNLTGAP